MTKATKMSPEEGPKMKLFAPVNPKLKVLESHEGDLGEKYCSSKWESPYRVVYQA